MTIECVWGIATLERQLADGRVTEVHYGVQAHDGTYKKDARGSIALDGEATIPYKDLTPEICIGWVHQALGEERVQEIEQALARMVLEEAEPTKGSGVPWANAA